MTTSNPVPSYDPSDLLFNAGKLDEVLNGTGTSFTDRLGTARRTVAGMNADFDAQLADAESDLNVYRADAAASAAEALGYLQTYRATSYGAYASDPATDPLGNPPTEGDEYFNTTAKLLKRFNGSTWQASDINTANLAAPSGSSLVGFDGGTVQDVLDNAKAMQSYAALRAYTGRATGVRITTPGIDGFFQRRGTVGLDDNGVDVIIDAYNRAWERITNGEVRVSWAGAVSNAFDLAVASIGASSKTLVVDANVTISANTTVPQNITLQVQRGSGFSIASGVTLTVLGNIDAGDYQIFSGLGNLDCNAGAASFNIAWFEGEWLNDKWDFILRGVVSLRPFTVFVPKPEKGTIGSVEVSTDLVYWGIDAPIVFPDKANGCQWVNASDARIIAVSAVDAMLEFSTDSKIEDVNFGTGVWLEGDAKAAHGMKFHGGSRVRSDGIIQISGCEKNLYFDNTGGSNDKIRLNSLYLSRWSTAAIWVEGSGSAMVFCDFPEVIMEMPAADLTNGIVARGATRGLHFGRIHYIHFEDAKVLENALLVQSTENGYSLSLSVDEIYTTSAAKTLVKIENSGGSTRAISTKLGKLTGADNTVAASLNYDIYTSIGEYTCKPPVYGVNCQEPVEKTSVIARTYDFAVHGGAVQTYTLGGSLPKGARIVRTWYVVETALASSGLALFRIGITGSLAGIQANTLYSNAVWSVGIHDGIPDGTASKSLPVVANSTTNISVVVADAPLTAGKITVYAQYVL